MANTRTRAWGPTHPSAAFLIKCAKEKEKLRSTFQTQLQEHMLFMLEEALFSDILIGVNTGKQCPIENGIATPKHNLDLPHFYHAHKPVLKVRTPAFLEHLKKHEESNLGVTSYNSFLEEAELRQFLRKVYTDDDIRKHECEALIVSRTYAEILCQHKALMNKRIVDVDEFERESVNSTCTDSFVTPKTSPITPEKALDVSDMFRQSQKWKKQSVTEKKIKFSPSEIENVLENVRQNNSNKKVDPATPVQGELSEGYVSELDNTHDEESILGLTELNFCNPTLGPYYAEKNSIPANKRDKSHLIINECFSPGTVESFPSPVDLENEEIQACEDTEGSPKISGMVRSNTFDLQTQARLEDVIDDENQWYSEDNVEHIKFNKIENSVKFQNIPSEDEVVQNTKSECSGFFLHDHTPSPKPNLFKSSFSRDSLYQDSGDNINAPHNNVHLRRLDCSMSDSGFMSHSTFSMFSDTGMPNSISSSLVMSSDSNLSPGPSFQHSTEIPSSSVEHSKKGAGSMFPFYIDINNMPPEKLMGSKEEKKLSPSSVYMFIDASKTTEQKKITKYEGSSSKAVDLNVKHNTLFSKFVNGIDHKSQEHLIKARSTPQLDILKDLDLDSPKPLLPSRRPQSCYMYVDLDSVEDIKRESVKDFNLKRAPSSISMFIDLNEEFKETKSSTNGINICQETENVNFSTHTENKDLKQNDKSIFKVNTDCESYEIQKRKLSDSFLSNSYQESMDSKVKFHSLRNHDENRSDSALDYPSFCKQTNLMKSESVLNNYNENSAFNKSNSMHRSSEILYFDSSYSKRNSSSNCSSSFESKLLNDSQYIQSLNSKIFNQSVKLSELIHGSQEISGEKLGADGKKKQKEPGDVEVSKVDDISREAGLLPMSPILRRKMPNKELPKPSPPVVIKASTRPQDIDAMTFRRPEKDESSKLASKANSQEDNLSGSIIQYGSPSQKKSEHSDDAKSSSESVKLESEALSEYGGIKDKSIDLMSRSESSVITVSGGDTSSSDKPVPREDIKDRFRSSASWSYEFEDDSETIYSEVSDVSSSLGGAGGIASLERRWREGHNLVGEISTHGIHMYRMLEACSKLGEDLLRMFLEEIDTDVIIELDGKQIKAHRCILTSRCKYFASKFKGNYSEDSDSIISLQGFSYPTVHFALCHIYSGAMNLPKDVNITELALVAEVLNLDTLTDVIVLHMKMHFCHFFHRPCSQCTQGVIECLPLAALCGLNEIRDKCIHWLGRYFTRTWPNKAFAALPEDFRDLCYNSAAQNLTVDSVIDMTVSCDQIITTLPQLKWTEPIFGMVSRLLQDCIHFMANNFNQMLCSEGFLSLGKGQSWNVAALEDDIISAVELMNPDMACKSSVKLSQIIPLAESGVCSEYGDFTQNFLDLLHKINRHCERYLIHNANKVVHCQSWACLTPEMQKRIKDAAVIVFEFEKATAPPPRLSSLNRKLKKQKDSEETGCLERSTYPKKGRPVRIKHFYKESSQISDKTFNIPGKREKDEKSPLQRREVESMIKKIVSPIIEESHGNVLDSSSKDASIEGFSSLTCNRLFRERSHDQSVDIPEEDSLKEMQDLPQDHLQISHNHLFDASHCSNSIGALDFEDNQSGAHCSDNPDSLDANEEMSSDSKDDIDCSVSVEDGSHQEKAPDADISILNTINAKTHAKKEDHRGIPVKTKVTHAPKNTSHSKSGFVARENKVPHFNPSEDKQKQSNYCDTPSCKKSPVKSFVPLSKAHIAQENKSLVSPEATNKDLVAEIDADSRMVTHCLQEAEMLEQQLSRKLQRQHQAVSASNISHCVHGSPIRAGPGLEVRRSSRVSVSKVQKSSSASQMKIHSSTPTRGRSPGKPLTPSPSSPHVPRLLRGAEGVKDQKVSGKKLPQSPKSNNTSTQRSFRSMESITPAHQARQVSGNSPAVKRVSSRSTRSRSSVIATSREGRAASSGPK